VSRRPPWRPLPVWKRPEIVHARRIRAANALHRQAEQIDAERAAKAPAPRGPGRR
jgi:hypothetical protein